MFLKLIFSILLCCTFSPIINSKVNDDLLLENNYFDSNLRYYENMPNKYVKCLNGDNTFEKQYTYEFDCPFEVSDVYLQGDASLLNFSVNEFSVSCEVGDFLEEGQFSMMFLGASGDQNETFDIYYCKNSKDVVYSTVLSIDVARRNAGKDLLYKIYKAPEQNNIMRAKAATRGIGASGSVSGYVNWQDDNGTTRPSVGAKVEVTIDGSWWSSTTYTNEYGYYEISYSNIWYIGSGRPTVHVYTSGENVTVKYSDVYEIFTNFTENSYNNTCDFLISPIVHGDMGKAMIIFQAAQQFAAYAKSLPDSNNIRHCDLVYPGDPSDGCYYERNKNQITITSKTRDNSGVPHSYASWDVIGHEYGHHIQNCLKFSPNVSGDHSSFQNDIDANVPSGGTVTSEIKNKGLMLAWKESWPTYFSVMAQTNFYYPFKTLDTVNDTDYTSYNGLDYTLNPGSYPVDCALGDGCERAIMRFLYKLSSPTIDNFDKFSISFESIWNVVTTYKPKAFYEFIGALYECGVNKHDLGLLLSVFNISVGEIKITNNYLDRCPTFTWSNYMGSGFLYNNSFDLVFINSRGKEILRKSNIVCSYLSSSNVSYTLSRNEWSNIISESGRTYYAYVISRQTAFFNSGNYYSDLFEFTEPDDFVDKVQIKPNEWGFESQYFFSTNQWKQTSTPITDHGITITHNRLRCGYIENSYVVLSPKRQNAGYAYLTMTFSQPIYSYMFGVCLWSNSEGLNPSNCTAVVESMDAGGHWTEDLDLLNDITLSTRAQQIDRYEIATPTGIYGLRFVVSSPATGTTNKGRICLDDIVLNNNINDIFFISTFYE